MKKNYLKDYNFLVQNKKKPKDYTMAYLFDMASQLAVAGNYEGKAKIYFEFIKNHPNASESDLFIVDTYKFDLERRKGQAAKALWWLSCLQMPDCAHSFAKADYWQAQGQCYLMLDRLKEALSAQKLIFNLPDFVSFPIDKRLYFLETILAMKQKAAEFDDEFREFLADYFNLTQDSSLTGVKKERVLGVLFYLMADTEQSRKDYSAAAQLHYFHFIFSPAERGKAVGALKCLYCSLQLKKNIGWFKDIKQYFITNKELLQQTDIAQLQAEYDFVCNKLGIK